MINVSDPFILTNRSLKVSINLINRYIEIYNILYIVFNRRRDLEIRVLRREMKRNDRVAARENRERDLGFENRRGE